jgi:pyrroline-5-carboxylate reductase
MTADLLDGRCLAVLGAGKIGSLLVRSFLAQGLVTPQRLRATVRRAERAQVLGRELAVDVSTDNVAATRDADVVLLCVKPQTVTAVLAAIRPELGPEKLLISVAASVPTEYIEQHVGAGVPVVRAMPNTPCAVGSGMTGLCAGRYAEPEHLETARALFQAVGRTVVVEERLMDAVTGLSASGPAFLYVVLESLIDGGLKVGLPRDVATVLAAQTMLGAARMALETGDHPALLKDAVTTPAGCTIDGILELEEGKLRVTLIKAVVKATERAGQLLVKK